VVVLSDPNSVFENVSGAEYTEASDASICINGKILIKSNGADIESRLFLGNLSDRLSKHLNKNMDG